MATDKKGILARAKAAARETTAVTDEGLRAYTVSYTHLTLPTNREV